MSIHLAIDTATDVGSVAVGAAGAVVSELSCAGRRHAAALVPAINEALRLGGVEAGDLSGLIVADGPGSFTGLRLGFATAKGILRAHDRLVLRTAPSLLATAWSAHHYVCAPVVALYDALRGQVFAAVYDWPGKGVEPVVAPVLCTVAWLREECPITPAVAVGDGAVAYRDEVRQWTGREPPGPPWGAPRASALLELLDVEGATRMVTDATAFEPTYGRLAEAQVRWEMKHGRTLPSTTGDTG